MWIDEGSQVRAASPVFCVYCASGVDFDGSRKRMSPVWPAGGSRAPMGWGSQRHGAPVLLRLPQPASLVSVCCPGGSPPHAFEKLPTLGLRLC